MKIINRLIAWLLSTWLFTMFRTVEPAAPVVEPKKRRQSKAKREANSERKKSIASLLGSLDHTFKELARADSSASWTDHNLRKNLRDMGPIVPYGDWSMARDVQYPNRLPALAFASTSFMHGDEDTIFAQFVYACKVNKFGHNVMSPAGGIKYECGVCYTTGKNRAEEGIESKLRLYWMNFDVTVNPHSGKVTVCKRRQSRHHKVGTNSHNGGFMRREWGLPGDTTEQQVANIVTAALNLTTVKNDNWTISVRKNGQRMTFVIPDNEAKLFFSDREKVYVNGENGRKRPIMHIVEGHQRNYKSGKVADVPTHVRGLRKFDWNGYSCIIAAPDFHTFQSQTFEAPAHVDLEDQNCLKHSHVQNIGQVLALMEDEQDPVAGRAIMDVRNAG